MYRNIKNYIYIYIYCFAILAALEEDTVVTFAGPGHEQPRPKERSFASPSVFGAADGLPCLPEDMCDEDALLLRAHFVGLPQLPIEHDDLDLHVLVCLFASLLARFLASLRARIVVALLHPRLEVDLGDGFEQRADVTLIYIYIYIYI
jgi:hypothetical protein